MPIEARPSTRRYTSGREDGAYPVFWPKSIKPMSKYADRVYTDQNKIAELEALVTQLPSEARVALLLEDGRELRGTVPERPTVQIFRDAREQEGVNAFLRLDDLADPSHQHQLWLDQVRKVTSLGSF